MEILQALLALITKDPTISGIVVASVVALVGLGWRIAVVTKTKVDDSIFGFLGRVLGLKPPAADAGAASSALTEAPGQLDLPLLREREPAKDDQPASRSNLRE